MDKSDQYKQPVFKNSDDSGLKYMSSEAGKRFRDALASKKLPMYDPDEPLAKFELWRKHPKWDRLLISSFGRALSLVRGRTYLSWYYTPAGFPMFRVKRDGVYRKMGVARTVMETFVPLPPLKNFSRPRIVYLDGDYLNCHLLNLRYYGLPKAKRYYRKEARATPSERERHWNWRTRRLTPRQTVVARRLRRDGWPVSRIALQLECSEDTVRNALRRDEWLGEYRYWPDEQL